MAWFLVFEAALGGWVVPRICDKVTQELMPPMQCMPCMARGEHGRPDWPWSRKRGGISVISNCRATRKRRVIAYRLAGGLLAGYVIAQMP